MPTPDDTIDQAIGVLMWRHDLDDNDAFRRLVGLAQDNGSAVVDAAREVLEHALGRTSHER
jgi:AmiR/NasT family two-component response regulator